jgi:colicin import membrane protein
MERQRQAEAELAQRVAVEERRFAEDLARHQTEPVPAEAAAADQEADVFAALAAEQLAREAERYIPAIQERIAQFWVRPLASGRGLSSVVALRLIPGGEVVPNSVHIVTSSGLSAFDQSAIAAVYHASPLPVPTGAAFAPFREFYFTFQPE